MRPDIGDLSVRDPVDATGLVHHLLSGLDWASAGFDPVVQPEVTPTTDSVLLSRDVVLYHCGAPYQPDWNVQAWVWRFTLALTVLSPDPERGNRLCMWLHRQIGLWPYGDMTSFGKVGRIVDNPAFQLVSSGDMTSAKTIRAFSSVKLLQAASPA